MHNCYLFNEIKEGLLGYFWDNNFKKKHIDNIPISNLIVYSAVEKDVYVFPSPIYINLFKENIETIIGNNHNFIFPNNIVVSDDFHSLIYKKNGIEIIITKDLYSFITTDYMRSVCDKLINILSIDLKTNTLHIPNSMEYKDFKNIDKFDLNLFYKNLENYLVIYKTINFMMTNSNQIQVKNISLKKPNRYPRTLFLHFGNSSIHIPKIEINHDNCILYKENTNILNVKLVLYLGLLPEIILKELMNELLANRCNLI